jgi:hypothetical protein
VQLIAYTVNNAYETDGQKESFPFEVMVCKGSCEKIRQDTILPQMEYLIGLKERGRANSPRQRRKIKDARATGKRRYPVDNKSRNSR